MIKSIGFDQIEMLQNILFLHCKDGIELDATFSKGNFYKDGLIQQPTIKYDLCPQTGVMYGDCRRLPLQSNSIKSIMFDPPFIVGLSSKNVISSSLIANRFSAFSTVDEMHYFYDASLIEFYRLLRIGGVLIVKCQDTVSSGKQYLSHVYIINKAVEFGFYTKDLFVLLAKSRMIGHNHKQQQHARKFHSYFIVFIKFA